MDNNKQNQTKGGIHLEDAATEAHAFEHLVEAKSSNQNSDGACIVTGSYC